MEGTDGRIPLIDTRDTAAGGAVALGLRWQKYILTGPEALSYYDIARILSAAWPALPLGGWASVRSTLHRWMQIVGKIRLVPDAAVPLARGSESTRWRTSSRILVFKADQWLGGPSGKSKSPPRGSYLDQNGLKTFGCGSRRLWIRRMTWSFRRASM